MKRFIIRLATGVIFVAALAMAGGCVMEMEDEQMEEVDSVQQSILQCPEMTECHQLCGDFGMIWRGTCTDEGNCLCLPDIPRPGGGGHGGGEICYINWNVGWGQWECLSY